MPRPLTIAEAARRLGRDRSTVKRRVDDLGLRYEVAMTEAQFRRLKEDFKARPMLPRGASIGRPNATGVMH